MAWFEKICILTGVYITHIDMGKGRTLNHMPPPNILPGVFIPHLYLGRVYYFHIWSPLIQFSVSTGVHIYGAPHRGAMWFTSTVLYIILSMGWLSMMSIWVKWFTVVFSPLGNMFYVEPHWGVRWFNSSVLYIWPSMVCPTGVYSDLFPQY